MSDVTFTKNMAPENRAAGLKALQYFFDNSIFQIAPYNMVTSFQGMISNFDTKYPTYIEFLGETVLSLTDDQWKQSMLDVTRNGKRSYPTPADFGNAVLNNVTSLRSDILSTTKIISETAKESVSTLLSMGQTFVKYLPYIAVGAVGLVLFLQLGGGQAMVRRAIRSNPSRKKRRKRK